MSKQEIHYHQTIMDAYAELRYIIHAGNIDGKFYTSAGEFIYKTDKNAIYSINKGKEGYYIATYAEKKSQ